MAASHVLTLGYGNGTLAGSAALVLSLGYGIGAAVVVSEGIEYALGSLSLEYALPRLPEFTEPNDTPEFAL